MSILDMKIILGFEIWSGVSIETFLGEAISLFKHENCLSS